MSRISGAYFVMDVYIGPDMLIHKSKVAYEMELGPDRLTMSAEGRLTDFDTPVSMPLAAPFLRCTGLATPRGVIKS